MKNTLFFGNGINRLSDNAVSWCDLLDRLKTNNHFVNIDLPYTMVYERIFMEKFSKDKDSKSDELAIKNIIASEMMSQESNFLFELLAKMNFENYVTTNYDYAFEKAINRTPEKLSTEDIYSLRRKRAYLTPSGKKFLWNIHGEIDSPKSIMLGLDHYCGSVSKIDSYVKGGYKHFVEGEQRVVIPMVDKLKNEEYCYTSWVDLFFSSNVHVIGFSLDYSETDIWWVLNKRARLAVNNCVNNKIYFYTSNIDEEKLGLLNSFDVRTIITPVVDNDFKSMYLSAVNNFVL